MVFSKIRKHADKRFIVTCQEIGLSIIMADGLVSRWVGGCN